MTTTIQNPFNNSAPKNTRFLGTIIKDPEVLISGKNNQYVRLKVVASNGTGVGDTFWNLTVMKNLKDKLPVDLFKKFAYAKWIGMATSKQFESKKNPGTFGTDWSMLVNGVELQSGEYISGKDDKSEDEAF